MNKTKISWEYLSDKVNPWDDDEMDKFGFEGWEAYGHIRLGDDIVMLFKRPKLKVEDAG